MTLPSAVQHTQGGTASANTACPVSSAITAAGATLVIIFFTRGATAAPTFSSISGGTLGAPTVRVGPISTNAGNGNLYVLEWTGAASQAANALTINTSATGSIEYEFFELPPGFTHAQHVTAISPASNTAPSSGNLTPKTANPLLLGAFAMTNATVTDSALPAAPWANDGFVTGTASSAGSRLQPGYNTNPSHAAQAYTGTLGNAENWAAVLLEYTATLSVSESEPAWTDTAHSGAALAHNYSAAADTLPAWSDTAARGSVVNPTVTPTVELDFVVYHADMSPAPGVLVTVTPSATAIVDGESVTQQPLAVRTNGYGFASVQVYANPALGLDVNGNQLVPYYTVVEDADGDNPNVYAINVPDTNGPYTAASLQVGT